MPLDVTEHRAHRCLCGNCGTVTGSVFPHGVTAPVPCGPHITAWVSSLLHARFLPKQRLAGLMNDRFTGPLSAAITAAMGRRSADRFEDCLAHVSPLIRTVAPVKHLDQTDLRVGKGRGAARGSAYGHPGGEAAVGGANPRAADDARGLQPGQDRNPEGGRAAVQASVWM